MKLNRLGKSELNVSSIGFGTSPLGNMPDTYGYGVTEEQAIETLIEIFNSDVNFLDTSRNYGFGRSEERIGMAIREHGGLPDDMVLSTKLDRDMDSNRFDAARARRSFEESLEALGLDRVHILHLHDPEYAADLDDVTKSGGAIDELLQIKAEGLTDAVGLAMGRLDLMFPLLKSYDFDVLISHNRYTLLNRQADELFDYAYEHDIGIINAAPFAGGALAKGSSTKRVTYQEADPETLERVGAIETACTRFDIPIATAALQFSTRDPRISSTLLGISKPSRVQQTIYNAASELPTDLVTELETLPYSVEDPEANRVYHPG